MPAQEVKFCCLVEELGDIFVSGKVREPGKEGLDFSKNMQQEMGPVCQTLHSYNQEVRADMGRATVTRKERERLHPQQDIEIADFNHNQILAKKVQSCLGFEAGIPFPGIPPNSRNGNSGNVPFVDTGIPDSRIGIPGMSVFARTWNGPN